MKFFEKYTSNSIAGAANQHIFYPENPDESITTRVFYKIATEGKFNYSLLFSNILDSTYFDGATSNKNMLCDSWVIENALVARCTKDIPAGKAIDEAANEINLDLSGFQPLTFDGNRKKEVAPGEFFCSDSFRMTFAKGDYLCLELTFKGAQIPYHEEIQIPTFVKTESGWEYSRKTPVALMVGCQREVKRKIAYVGDSITQGIGVPRNSYKHWNSLLSELLGEENAYWNLGIGFGRANDIASLGAWAFKAKQNDVLLICYGVNDIFRIRDAKTTCQDIERLVDYFKAMGKKVVLQTVPPFDYQGEDLIRWNEINDYLCNHLSKKVDLFFDNRPILGDEKVPQKAIYGGHPDSEGCELWAKALYEAIKASNILED